jgi:rubrerythrin
MKLIQKFTELIEDELESAEDYIKMAVMHKDEHPMLAKVLYDISSDEMHHVDMLHDEVVKLIEEHRREKGDPPAMMLAVYNYLHERHIDKANKIKIMQSEYRK